ILRFLPRYACWLRTVIFIFQVLYIWLSGIFFSTPPDHNRFIMYQTVRIKVPPSSFISGKRIRGQMYGMSLVDLSSWRKIWQPLSVLYSAKVAHLEGATFNKPLVLHCP